MTNSLLGPADCSSFVIRSRPVRGSYVTATASGVPIWLHIAVSNASQMLFAS
jgi:hypothetical protein